MCRKGMAPLVAWVIACIAIGPAWAADETSEDLNERVEDLAKMLENLELRQQARLESQIQDYLAQTSAFTAADGEDPMKGIKITAHLTALTMGTVGLDPGNSTVATGNIRLRFDFKVSENVQIYIDANAYRAGSSFPAQFGFLPGPGGGAPRTLSGLSDGIGVDGTVSIAPGGRTLSIVEAAVIWGIEVGGRKLFIEFGSLDPRRRFGEQSFALDSNRQFMNNVFVDSAAVLWLTDATGRSSLGLHLWIDFGANDQFRVNTGYFNTTGQFWDSGQWYIQFRWRGEVAEREMNVRIFGFINRAFRDAIDNDGSEGGGLTWDWWVTDKIGLFITLTANDGRANPIEADGTLGIVFRGLIGRRPNDELAIAVASIKVNRDHPDPAINMLPSKSEKLLEIYYKFVEENGYLQITPFIQFVSDPGGGGTGWLDNTLIMVGIRIHVPF